MNDIFNELDNGDDLSPLDGALEAGEIFEIAAEFSATVSGDDLLAAIDGDLKLNGE